MKWNEEQLKAIDESVLLWDVMAGIKTKKVDFELSTEFKNSILHKLGIPDKIFGCPFCEKFHCWDCPIVIYSGEKCYHKACPYIKYQCYWNGWIYGKSAIRGWVEKKTNHSQPLAKKFAKWLEELRKWGV